jgi:hypothetical protein
LVLRAIGNLAPEIKPCGVNGLGAVLRSSGAGSRSAQGGLRIGGPCPSLDERKAQLAKLLAKPPDGIHYSEHLEGDGAAIFAHACRLGAEGIVSKHREHPYRSGTSKAWLKTKNPAAPGMLRFREES